MTRISIESGYSDIYSDLYGEALVGISVEVAFTTAPGATPSWTDISPYVESFSTRRGRSSEFDTFSAGTASIVLKNDDRRFDPVYTSSPYYPNLLPMRRVRVRTTYSGVTYDLFNGYVDGWPQGYNNPRGSFVNLPATDAFKVLASVSLPSVWEQEIRADSPALWGRLGEPAGTSRAWDASGNGRDGTYDDDPQLGQTGAILADPDQAATFQNIVRSDGLSEAAHATFPSPVSGTQDFSVEFWWFAPSVGTNPAIVPLHQGPTGRGSAAGTGFAWEFFYSGITVGIGPYTSTTSYKFKIYDTTGASTTATYSYSYDWAGPTQAADPYANRWRHLVATRSGTTVKLYVDGVLAETVTAGGARSMRPDNVVVAPGSGDATLDEVVVYTTALSAARVLAHYQAATAGWQGDATDERIERVLDFVGWSSVDRDISDGDSTLQLADLRGDSSLAHMQDVELTESGRLFVSVSGKVTFVNRHALLNETPYATSQATFGDSGVELRYAEITFDYSDKQIRNDIEVSAPALPTQVTRDATSQTAYLKRGYTRQVLESSPARMKDAANYILGRYKDPFLRVESISIKPRRDESGLYPQVLGREIGERVTIKRRPQAVGSAISQECHIESIAHRVDAETQTWVTTWTLSPADTRTYWRLGHATAGKLGTTTRLAY